MLNQKIALFPDREDVFLEMFVADPLPNYTRKSLLIIPGGSYSCLGADREGEAIAIAFLAHGYNAFVLHYSIAGRRVFPEQLIEASAAVKYIRDHAKDYQADADKVFAIGFSAGGHLAAMLGTLWHRKEIYDTVSMKYGYNKPSGILAIYPVITADPRYSHADSLHNLIGTTTPTEEQLSEVSPEKHVDERSCPCFLVHTSNDEVVSVMNSLLFAQAYYACGKTFELHVYANAPHGIALGNDITSVGLDYWKGKNLEKWVESALLWMEQI